METMDTIADTTAWYEKQKSMREKGESEKERKLADLPRLTKMAAVKAILLAAPVYGV